jgi:hypothetical protein
MRCVCLLLPLAQLPAQVTATALFPPGFRAGHAMVYDWSRDRVVLFGGAQGTNTWEYDGSTWVEVAPTDAPSARSGHAMAYDVHRNRTVLFGGDSGSSALADTWEYDGTNWMPIQTATVPPGGECDAAYDIARARTVVVVSPPHAARETWEYDGRDWNFIPITPPAGDGPCMTYDIARARTVLLSGNARGSGANSQTWDYDGVQWILIWYRNASGPPALGPPAPRGAAAYDMAHGRVVTFGGQFDESMSSRHATFDGGSWTDVPGAVRPPGRGSHAMVYDLHRNRLLVVGGLTGSSAHTQFRPLADMWEFVGSWQPVNSNPPNMTARWLRGGPACSLPPSPTLDSRNIPSMGSSFPMDLTSLPASSGLAYLAFDTNPGSWATLPLGPFGLPGCRLETNPAIGVLLAYSGSSLTHLLWIPNNPAFNGQWIHTQALVADSLGLHSVSNDGRMLLY